MISNTVDDHGHTPGHSTFLDGRATRMPARGMRYHLRTVVWRFKESTEDLPGLKAQRSVILRSPEDVFRLYGDIFTDQVRERFVVIWLDASNKVIGFEVVTEGTLNSSLVHPREVFRGAIVATAASIIVAHNHPSGNPGTEYRRRRDHQATGRIWKDARYPGPRPCHLRGRRLHLPRRTWPDLNHSPSEHTQEETQYDQEDVGASYSMQQAR